MNYHKHKRKDNSNARYETKFSIHFTKNGTKWPAFVHGKRNVNINNSSIIYYSGNTDRQRQINILKAFTYLLKKAEALAKGNWEMPIARLAKRKLTIRIPEPSINVCFRRA